MAKKERPAKGRDTAPGGSGADAGLHRTGDLRIPGWLPPVLYGAVTLFLFRKFVFSNQMLLGQDTLSLGFVARDFFAEALRAGTFPFWNPLILGGTPFLDSLAGGDSLYPTSLLLVLLEPYRALGWKLVIHVFAAGLFTYGWIRALGRSQGAALLCGLAYLLAPFMVTLVYPGHDGKLFVTALTPLLFWATEKAMAGGRLRTFAGMALVIGLVIFTTHFQQAYFLFGAVGVYAAARGILLWKSGLSPRIAGVRFGLFLLFSVVGAGISAVQLVPAVGYVTEFSRRTATTTQATAEGSIAYSSSWSLHPEEIVSLVVPEFVGNSAGGAPWATGTYWGRNGFKLNHEYGGLVVLLLAVAAFFGAPSRGIRLTFLGLGSVALLFALGAHTPVWRLFYEVLPGISLFRAPSIAAFLFGFGAVTLMGFGIDRILGFGRTQGGGAGGAGTTAGEASKGDSGIPNDRDDPRLGWTLAAITGLLLLGTVLASSGTLTSLWTSLLYSDIDPGKGEALLRAQEFITRGFLVATLLSGATLGLVWAAQNRRIPAGLWLGGIGLLLVLDQARVDDPFIQTLDFQAWAAADANVRYLLEQQEVQDPFKVLAMGGGPGLEGGQDVKPGMYGLELAAGHHPNDLARYRELIGMVGSGIPSNFFNAEGTGINPNLFAILNVRYVIWPVYRFGGFPAGEPVMATTRGGGQAYEAVYEIPTLPRARLVGDAVVLSDDEAVPYILSPDFRPEAEVVLPAPLDFPLTGGPVEGEVRWLERGINASRLTVRSDGPALLVVADNWYPAWKARVGGEVVPVLRANHTLRAVPVPGGESEVEVFYDPVALLGPLILSLLSLLLVLGFMLLWRRGEAEGEGRGGMPSPDEAP